MNGPTLWKPILPVGDSDFYPDVVKGNWKKLASGLSVPSHFLDSDCYSSFANGATSDSAAFTSSFNLEHWHEEMLSLIRQMEVIRQQELKIWSRTIDQMQCPHCGRKPTVTGNSGPDVLHLCERTYRRLKAKLERAKKDAALFIAPWYGIALAPFPCEPRPPLQ